MITVSTTVRSDTVPSQLTFYTEHVMARLTIDDLASTIGDVGFASIRERAQRAIADGDPSILLDNAGTRKKLAQFVMAHPGGVAVGLDALTTFAGKIAGHYSPFAGKAIDEIGEAVAYGLRDLAIRARAGETITHEQVEKTIERASQTLHVVRALRSANISALGEGQRRAFFGLLQAARDEQISDHDGARDLSGDAFRIVRGLLFAIDKDPEILRQTLPDNLTFDQVYNNPRGTCMETIAMVATIEAMPWETALDVIDKTFNMNKIRKIGGSIAETLLTAIKFAVIAGVVGYVLFMVAGLGFFLINAFVFVGAHIAILFMPQGVNLTLVWTAMTVSFLCLLAFRYIFTLVDLIHSVVLWIAGKFGLKDEDSWLGSAVRVIAAVFKKDNIVEHLPARRPAGTQSNSIPWGVSFTSTVFIAAIAVFTLTLMNQVMGRTLWSAMLVVITEMLILLSVEITRRVGHKLSDKFHAKNAKFTIIWATRAALAFIATCFMVAFLGAHGIGNIVHWIRSGPESIGNNSPTQSVSDAAPGLTAKQKAVCGYAKKHKKKLPSYCD